MIKILTKLQYLSNPEDICSQTPKHKSQRQ